MHQQALPNARIDGSLAGMASALERLGRVAATAGAARQATVCLGAASRARERCGSTSGLLNRAEMESCLTSLRATLGGRAFECAWAAGRQMDLAAAVAQALRESDGVPDRGA
jgi:hypothetical protein